jgi:hypothetical protein
MSKPALDRSGKFRDDDEAGLLCFEPIDQGAIVKALVCADDYRSYARGKLGEAGLEKVDHAGGSVYVARPQLAVPEVSALAFEAEQWMVSGSAAFQRVVADPGLFLVAVDYQHCRVDIEDDACRW